MALILVVEPDSSRSAEASAHITPLRADVVRVDSAVHACLSLTELIPDVVLTSPLLPARDEAAIAAALRDLGPSAAHVQVLTLPIVGAPAARAATRHRLRSLMSWQGEAASETPSEWDLFSKQVAGYLELAEAQRLPVVEPAVAAASATAAAIELEPEDDEDGWITVSLDGLSDLDFFDPDQCKFATLVAKLDEVAPRECKHD